jgi:hypothetical protein
MAIDDRGVRRTVHRGLHDPDGTLLAQWQARSGAQSPAERSGELRLLLAILEQALLDLQWAMRAGVVLGTRTDRPPPGVDPRPWKAIRRDAADAWAWMSCETATGPTSFCTICQVLGLSDSAIRRAVRDGTMGQSIAVTRSGRTAAVAGRTIPAGRLPKVSRR